MALFQTISDYLNPVSKLGERKYSFLFPFFTTLLTGVFLELYVRYAAGNFHAADLLDIFLFILYILYFSFRDGMKGGFVSAFITVTYYFFIIFAHGYRGAELISGIISTVVLGIIYFAIAGLIGALKIKIDNLIISEADQKRRLQLVIHRLPVGILITDKNGAVEQSNRKLEEILGVKYPEGFVIGTDDSLLNEYQDSRINRSKPTIIQSIKTGREILDKEFKVKRRDGKDIMIRVSSSPVKDRKGKVVAAVSVINDITRQKKVEQRKDDFLNIVSHELKTPVTSMKLNTDILLSKIPKNDNSGAYQMLVSLKKQTGRLKVLVNDLLDVSRIRTGKMVLHKEKFRLDRMVREVMGGLKEVTSQKLSIPESNPVIVFADRFRISQVLINLINNAVKYSAGRGDINIRIKKVRNNAVVSIQDYGIGIDKSQHQKIFNRLYQVSGETVKSYSGFGMGLFISREIIRRHRGKIWVESEKGKGSVFYFSLPVFRKPRI